MRFFPVALQVYSVREDAAADLPGTLKAIREMGYDGVEFAGLYDYRPEEVAEMCLKEGLTPISAHVPFDLLNEKTEETVADYAKIGCRYIAIPYLTEAYRPGCPGFDEVVRAASVIGEACAKHGIELLYHNHDFEFAKVEGVYALDYLYDHVPAALLKTELDTCWVKVGGEDPCAYLDKYAGRAPVVHLKDFAGSKTENMYGLIGQDEGEKKADETAFQFRPVGYGVQDIPAILAASRRAGAKWVVVEQDMPSLGKTAMECAKMSIDYLRSL